MGVSVVVPVFRSGDTLRDLHKRLVTSLEKIVEKFELILVDDAGDDPSWAIIQELTQIDNRVVGIQLSRNYGQHNALLCGIRAARHNVVVTLDDDLQNPPEEIPKLLAKLSEGYDVVYGTPICQQHGFWRNQASRVTKLVLRSAMGAQTAGNVSAFRAFRSMVRTGFANYKSPFVSIDVLLTWGTTRFAAIPVRHEPRRVGRSSYTLSKLATHALNMMTGFSTLPLRFASVIGFVLTLFGVCVLIYVVGRYLLHGQSVAGFPFLASIIAIFSGAQLFATGVIGEYLARMHVRSMEQPPYLVRTISKSSTSSAEGEAPDPSEPRTVLPAGREAV